MSKKNVLSSQTLILKYVDYKLSMSIYIFLLFQIPYLNYLWNYFFSYNSNGKSSL